MTYSQAVHAWTREHENSPSHTTILFKCVWGCILCMLTNVHALLLLTVMTLLRSPAIHCRCRCALLAAASGSETLWHKREGWHLCHCICSAQSTITCSIPTNSCSDTSCCQNHWQKAKRSWHATGFVICQLLDHSCWASSWGCLQVGDKNFEYILPDIRLFVFSTKLPKAPECQSVGCVCNVCAVRNTELFIVLLLHWFHYLPTWI